MAAKKTSEGEAGAGPRFIVGIDLGTTNSAVAYVDLQEEREEESAPLTVLQLAVPQVTGPGKVEELTLLPSAVLCPAEAEADDLNLDLPWEDAPGYAVGQFARERGAERPGTVVTSAKSWLCHAGVDRRDAILPWLTPEAVEKVSPVTASARILTHIRDVWNYHAFPDNPLEEQQVVLTIPASFDPVARDLTLEAAREAGLPDITLLEEPQAAFYAWIHNRGAAWRKDVEVGDTVLVCDIGGGTTDFSLINVTDAGAGDLDLNRVAVGPHILVGGDNMDLLLAHTLRQRLAAEDKKLDVTQFLALVRQCARAKETLLTDEKKTEVPITILGRGRKVVGGALKTSLSREDTQSLLVDGFLPQCDADAEPKTDAGLGLREIGLPYAKDPAVTHHLAAFLRNAHAEADADIPAVPTAVLFNGGVLKSGILQDRLIATLNSWHDNGEETSTRVLAGADLDLACARGGVIFGLTRQGRGIRIKSGVAKSYYVGVESTAPAIPGLPPEWKALCLVPKGTEEGTTVPLPAHEFGLLIGQDATFRFLSATDQRADAPGTILDDADDLDSLEELAPLTTTLDSDDPDEAGRVIPVTLECRVTDIGTLEVFCIDARNADRRWQLEFNVRMTGEE